MLKPAQDLYPSLLGPSWATLAFPVQRLHAASQSARGVFRVRRGQSLGARILAALLGMPKPADAVSVTLTIERTAHGERWIRRFGDQPLRTAQWRRGELLVEAIGPTQCWFRLSVAEGALVFDHVKSAFGQRWFALPLPRWLAPRVEGRAEPSSESVLVRVFIYAPFFGLLVSYEGSVTLEAEGSP
jgi:hypothetical protein